MHRCCLCLLQLWTVGAVCEPSCSRCTGGMVLLCDTCSRSNGALRNRPSWRICFASSLLLSLPFLC